MKFKDVIAILERNGFAPKESKHGGSHRQYEGFHSDKRWTVTVAAHRLSEEVRPGTLQSMIRQSGLPKKLFR